MKDESQIERLMDFQESLESQRQQTLALILNEEEDLESEPMVKAKMKLALILQELVRCNIEIKNLKGRQNMGFEQPEKVEAIIKVVRKGIDPAIKEAMEVCHEAAAKVQVLVGRAEKFKAQKAGLDREIEALQEDLRGTLHAGGDPGDINRKIRAKKDECGDLTTWAAELRDKAIPTAEKVLEEAQNQLWRVMIGVVRTLRPTWDQELNEVLAQAAALSASWTVAIRKIFSEYSIRPPTDPISFLQVDPKLTNFRCGSSYIPLGIAAVNT